ncbi:MAG: hypothetical protein LUC43_07320, partial [Burkholderiales bacterium]|nr:hypothetical protein [Burkholderiales bacterium]
MPNYLKEHGIDIQATSKSLLNLEVNYSFVPTESKEWRYHREDVISGKTMCMPMLINFQNGNEYEINKLEAD